MNDDEVEQIRKHNGEISMLLGYAHGSVANELREYSIDLMKNNQL